MGADDAVDRRDDLFVFQRRAAAQPVPRKQEFQRDPFVDAVPQQMAGQRGDGGIPLPLRYATFTDGITSLVGEARCQHRVNTGPLGYAADRSALRRKADVIRPKADIETFLTCFLYLFAFKERLPCLPRIRQEPAESILGGFGPGI